MLAMDEVRKSRKVLLDKGGWEGKIKIYETKVVVQLEIVTNVPSSNVCSLKGDPVITTESVGGSNGGR